LKLPLGLRDIKKLLLIQVMRCVRLASAFYSLYHQHEEILEVTAFRAAAERRNRGRLTPNSQIFELDTVRGADGVLLGGLLWVAQERERLGRAANYGCGH
jgi:hypothetical protein